MGPISSSGFGLLLFPILFCRVLLHVARCLFRQTKPWNFKITLKILFAFSSCGTNFFLGVWTSVISHLVLQGTVARCALSISTDQTLKFYFRWGSMQLLYQNLWIVLKTGSFGLVLQQFAWNPVLVIIVCMMSPNLQFWTGLQKMRQFLPAVTFWKKTKFQFFCLDINSLIFWLELDWNPWLRPEAEMRKFVIYLRKGTKLCFNIYVITVG